MTTQPEPQRTGLHPGLIAGLVAIGLLLAGILVVLILLLTRPATPGVQAEPTPSEPEPTIIDAESDPEPEPEPAPTESAAPSTPKPNNPPATSTPKPPSGPTFASFSSNPGNNKSVGCADEYDSVPITIKWSSTNAVLSHIGVGTNNAKSQPYESNLPPSGSYDLNYQCSVASQKYTVTLEDASGKLTHRTVTLKR